MLSTKKFVFSTEVFKDC